MLTFWFHLYPDINKAIGGVKQVHRCAELLESLGHRAILVQDDPNFHPGWFKSRLKTISRREWPSLNLDPNTNIAVFAETFVLALGELRNGLPVILFNQNFSYTFGLKGQKLFDPSAVLRIYQSEIVLQVWCVSQYDRESLLNLGVPQSKIFTLANCVDSQPFPLNCRKNRQICFMPRKNRSESDVVVNLLGSRPNLHTWEFLPISNCSHDEVIRIMQSSLIFLSFGHPEGFGLPVAEALISGCSVIGFTGLGGRELFDLASKYKMAWPIEFGDLSKFLPSVDSCIDHFHTNKADYISRSRNLANLIYSKYSHQSMKDSLSCCLSLLS